jgi:CHC2 zinc finger
LAERLTEAKPGNLRRSGDTWSANCPLPDHEDKTPSFTVYPETNSWYCYGCLRGGNVVELYRLAKGYDQRDAHTAAAMLLMEFGHEVPKRPPAWFRKQERQKPMRDAIEDARVEVMARRVWRWIFEPIIAEIEDEEERVRASRELWAKLVPLTRRLLAASTAQRRAA